MVNRDYTHLDILDAPRLSRLAAFSCPDTALIHSSFSLWSTYFQRLLNNTYIRYLQIFKRECRDV